MPKRVSKLGGNSSYELSYLRRKKPVQVRRNLWRESSPWLIRVGLSLALVTAGVSIALSVETYVRKAPAFQISRNSPARVSGLRYTSRSKVEAILYRDEEMSVYDFPLEERRRQIEALPWIKHAALRRNWPDRLWVRVEERSPVAFVRLPYSPAENRSSAPQLVDGEGVFLGSPEGNQFAFPVITGINQNMPENDRAQRLRVYQKLVSALDATEPLYSSRISEVDIADPRNVKVLTAFDGEMVELQMGEKNFRHRFEVFLEYFGTWKKGFGRVKSVDLRYKGVVVTE